MSAYRLAHFIAAAILADVTMLAALAAWGERMTHAQFLRIKKLTGKGIIEVAARHNHREILAELGAAQGGRIDPA